MLKIIKQHAFCALSLMMVCCIEFVRWYLFRRAALPLLLLIEFVKTVFIVVFILCLISQSRQIRFSKLTNPKKFIFTVLASHFFLSFTAFARYGLGYSATPIVLTTSILGTLLAVLVMTKIHTKIQSYATSSKSGRDKSYFCFLNSLIILLSSCLRITGFRLSYFRLSSSFCPMVNWDDSNSL